MTYVGPSHRPRRSSSASGRWGASGRCPRTRTLTAYSASLIILCSGARPGLGTSRWRRGPHGKSLGASGGWDPRTNRGSAEDPGIGGRTAWSQPRDVCPVGHRAIIAEPLDHLIELAVAETTREGGGSSRSWWLPVARAATTLTPTGCAWSGGIPPSGGRLCDCSTIEMYSRVTTRRPRPCVFGTLPARQPRTLTARGTFAGRAWPI